MIATLFLTFLLMSIVLSGFLSLAIYFLPIIIAVTRKHKNIMPIVLIDIFLGWTFLGWLAALLWSLNKDVEKEEQPKVIV